MSLTVDELSISTSIEIQQEIVHTWSFPYFTVEKTETLLIIMTSFVFKQHIYWH